ncbi:metallophosphoesterase [Ligaoa zhengdingensis]|uniref:metallophosphoesterase n=1 Tax=Ligaoa zhengdingensis TaxID=2763658 RepID=UPI0031BA8AF3
MSVFAIGDLHLSLGGDKPMDVFPGWQDYVARLEQNWRALISPGDTVILAGDTSWAMTLGATLADFQFIHSLPGEKYLIKGNHDYWWNSRAKMDAYLEANGLTSLHILHNSAVQAEGMALCGTRGWLFEKGEAHDQKILAREAARLQMSIDAARDMQGERVVFLHYPPVYADETSEEIVAVLKKNGIRRCYYGHIHSTGCAYALNGNYEGIEFRLISSDFLRFSPIKIQQIVEF